MVNLFDLFDKWSGNMIFFLFLTFFSSSDQSKFRKCENSKFCSRGRYVPKQNWILDAKSIKSSSNSYEGVIIDGTNQNKLSLHIRFLSCGSVRVRIDPFNKEIFDRYDLAKEPTVVNQEEINKFDSFTYKSTPSSDILTAIQTSNQINNIEIVKNPFHIIINDKNGKRTTLNSDDSAIFEANFDLSKIDKELYNSEFDFQKDEPRNGPTLVAMSVDFHSTASKIRLSGLPSHTIPFTIPQTVNDTDPLRLYNTDQYRYDLNSTIAMSGSVPFVFAHSNSRNDGVFWCNPSETWADITNEDKSSRVRFISESGFIDIFIFSGKPKDIANSFTKITGRPQLVPEFALGFHQSRWGYNFDDRLMNISRNLDNSIVPHDSIWLNLDQLENRQYFTFNEESILYPSKLFDSFAEVHRYVVALVGPHFRANDNYKLYQQLSDSSKNLALRSRHGLFFGNSWPGKSVWPDFLNPDTRNWWESLFTYANFNQSRPNLMIWHDMNQPSCFDDYEMTIPRDSLHFGNVEEREVHNLYGHLMTSATFGGLMKRNNGQNIRPFIHSSSFFAGTQKYAIVSASGSSGNWETLQNSISLVLQYGLAGQVYSGLDVGGYFDSPDNKLLARWYQIGSWIYPFFRSHSHHDSSDREVYRLSGEEFEVAREAIVDRYKLLSYWYTLARNANLTGEPIVRPIWWEFDSIEEYHDSSENVMIGSSLLAAPFLGANDTEKVIKLPNGRWYCYRTLQEIKGTETKVTNNGGRTPVFVRGGSIIPIKEQIRRSTELMFKDPFTLIIALENNGKANGELYVDDGKTFDFMRNEYIHKIFSFDGQRLTASNINANGLKSSFATNYQVKLDQIKIVGSSKRPTKIFDKSGHNFDFVYENGVIIVSRANIDIKDDFEINISF